MRIDKIEFKNIFAYGEHLNTIEYTDSGKLILLKGRSGSGKSAIMSLPCLVLYGKAGDIPKSGYANRINKNGYIKAHIVNNGHNYLIERGFAPNFLKVYKDGIDVDSAGLKDAQDFISNEIEDMPEKTFTGLMSISMKDFKGFLKMKMGDRKAIIDNIFSLGIINKAYDNIKADARELSNNINAENAAIFSLSTSLSNAMSELHKVMSSELIDEYNKEIELNNSEIQKAIDAVNSFTAQKNAVMQKQNECNEKLREVVGSMSRIDSEISILQNKINLFSKDCCPTCGASFKSTECVQLKEQLEKSLEEKHQEKTNFQNAINTYYDFLKKVRDALTALENNINAFNNSMLALKSRNAALNAGISSNSQYDAINNIIKSTQSQIDEKKSALEQYTKELKLLQKLLLVFSIDGIKEKVIEKYIPLINSEIKKNLEILNFPYQLTFDAKFESCLKDMNQKIQVETLSDGEMTRVDLVVICALLKIMKFKFPSINTFHLDETISTLDADTGCIVLKFLKDFAKETSINIVVVTHVDVSQDNFDELIEVTKNNGFSEISTCKLS